MAQGLKDARLVRTGFGCNNACRFCDQGDWRHTRGDAADDQVAAQVAAAASAGGLVVLSGGEVTLRPALPEWVALARRSGARRVVVQTNARMLAYKAYAERLIEAGADVIAVALHGHSAAVHDWLTRVEGSFEQTVRGARNAARAGATLLVNTVVTRPNFRHLPEIAALAHQLGARQLRLLWPREAGVAAQLAPELLAHPELVLPRLQQTLEIAHKLGLRLSIEEPGAPAPSEHDVHLTA